MRCYSRFTVLLSLPWMLCSLSQTVWGAPSPSCSQLYNTKRYLESARCFLAKAKQMKPGHQLNDLDRAQKEEYVLRTIQALTALASQVKMEKAALIRERAVKLLDWILREKLCEPQQCRKHRVNREKLRQQIGYARLTIETGTSTSAKIEIRGHRYLRKHQAPPSWSQVVRPGLYMVEVRYKDHAPLRRQVRISPGQASRIIFDPPRAKPPTRPLASTTPTKQKRPSASTITPTRRKRAPAAVTLKQERPPQSGALPWIVVGLGAAVLAAGVIAMGVGYANGGQLASNAASIRSDAVNKTDTQLDLMLQEDRSAVGVQKMYQSAQTSLVFGWIAVGTGATAALSGTLWWLLRSRNHRSPSTTPPPTRDLSHSFTWKE